MYSLEVAKPDCLGDKCCPSSNPSTEPAMLDWTVPLVAFLLAGSRAHYRCDDGSECECGVAGPGADTAGNSTEFPLAEDGGGEIDNSTEAGEFPLGESEK